MEDKKCDEPFWAWDSLWNVGISDDGFKCRIRRLELPDGRKCVVQVVVVQGVFLIAEGLDSYQDDFISLLCQEFVETFGEVQKLGS